MALAYLAYQLFSNIGLVLLEIWMMVMSVMGK
jgi:hypothetical protein